MNLFLFLTPAAFCAPKQYVMIDFMSMGLFERGKSATTIMGGDVDAFYTDDGEVKLKIFDSEQACFDAVKAKLEDIKEREFDFVYAGSGAYKYAAGYGRVLCLDHDIAKEYVSPADVTNFALLIFDREADEMVESKFTKEHPGKIKNKIVEAEIKDYTIFPMADDIEAAKEFTERLDKQFTINNEE
jgi:hypothetical protein